MYQKEIYYKIILFGGIIHNEENIINSILIFTLY